jgi:hypothetical protein
VSPRWLPDSEIVIQASPSEFVFRDSVDELRLPTVLWLSLDGTRLEAVDERVPSSPSTKRVELFKPASSDPDIPRIDLLMMLLRHGLKRFMNETVFKVRPTVRFASLRCFDSLLSGFQRDLFEHAALGAGARLVRFDDPRVSDVETR